MRCVLNVNAEYRKSSVSVGRTVCRHAAPTSPESSRARQSRAAPSLPDTRDPVPLRSPRRRRSRIDDARSRRPTPTHVPSSASTAMISETRSTRSPTRSARRNVTRLPAHSRRGNGTGGRNPPRFACPSVSEVRFARDVRRQRPMKTERRSVALVRPRRCVIEHRMPRRHTTGRNPIGRPLRAADPLLPIVFRLNEFDLPRHSWASSTWRIGILVRQPVASKTDLAAASRVSPPRAIFVTSRARGNVGARVVQ